MRALDQCSVAQLCAVNLPALLAPAELREEFKLDAKPEAAPKPKATTDGAGRHFDQNGRAFPTCMYNGCEYSIASKRGPCIFHERARNRHEIDAITAGIVQNAGLAYVWFRLSHGMHEHWARDWHLFDEREFNNAAKSGGVEITDAESWQDYHARVRDEVTARILQHQPVIDLRADKRSAI